MLKRFLPVLLLVVLCWVVFGLNLLLWHGDLNRYGILPRHVDSWPGILFSPFLHGSVQHLTANSVPLLIFGGVIAARGLGTFSVVTASGILLGGALTWLFGRPAVHIGASGLIFCYFGYLASLAIFRHTLGSLVISVVCLVLYGGMIRGILPSSPAVSWESHAAGLVAGILVAAFSAKETRRADASIPGSAR